MKRESQTGRELLRGAAQGPVDWALKVTTAIYGGGRVTLTEDLNTFKAGTLKLK